MDKMREEFERWSYSTDKNPNGSYIVHEVHGAWLAWQHLYPMVEAAYREGHDDGWHVGYDRSRKYDHANCDWQESTAKARLEGKDE